MANSECIEFECLKVTQPIGAFYIGVMQAKDLIAISYADVRRIEERDVERVVGVQRPLSPARVAELKKYVNTVDAAFPTSVILAIESEHAQYDARGKIMTITRDEKVARIIDGQHRIAGLEAFEGSTFGINVSLFVDMDIEDQAMLFATINLTQTKVNRSLMYDLYEFASSRSPQKTCHNIAKLLNQKERSPFRDKIKILGRATGKPQETLTQAAFVERLMPYITKDPMHDRDLIKRGQQLKRAGDEEAHALIFRNCFIEDDDAKIAKNLWNYFSAVAARWPEAWPRKERGNILNRTTGFAALMRFLQDAYLKLGEPGGVVTQKNFASILNRVKLKDSDFTPERFIPGSSGEGDLYRQFLSESKLT